MLDDITFNFVVFICGIALGVVFHAMFLTPEPLDQWDWRKKIRAIDAQWDCEGKGSLIRKGIWIADNEGEFHCVKTID